MQSFTQKLVGQTVNGRFEIGPLIAEGGMGSVFEGKDLQTGHIVAVKVLRHTLDRSIHQRFDREAEVILRFEHPNLVKLYDRGEVLGLPVLVLEFVEGISLGRMLLQGRLSAQATIQMGLAVADGLAHAHRHGVIHRDLKPDNILIQKGDGKYTAKLVDFGVAHAVSDNTNLTVAGSICGTPGYVSPEQIHGEKVTPAADLYSLGIVFFESLTGARAFPGTAALAVLLSQAKNTPPSLSTFPMLEVPDALRDLIEVLMSRDPKDRPPSADHVVSRLASMLDPTTITTIEISLSIWNQRLDGLYAQKPINRFRSRFRIGGGWDELLAGNPSAKQEVVIDPELFDVNPRQLDVSFEFTEIASYTTQDEPTNEHKKTFEDEVFERTASGWDEREVAPISQEDYSSLELARPIRDAPKTVVHRPSVEKPSPLLLVAMVVVIIAVIVSIFYWRAKEQARQMPPDVVEEAIAPIPDVPTRWAPEESEKR